MEPQLNMQEALLQAQEAEDEKQLKHKLQNERQETLKNLNIITQLKSFEILKSAVTHITSSTKFMPLMILSMLPLFASIVFLEIKITLVKDTLFDLLVRVAPLVSNNNYADVWEFTYDIDAPILADTHENDSRGKIFRIILDLFPFHLVLLPLVELFSFFIIINVAEKMYAGQVKTTTLQEIFYQEKTLKSSFTTSLWVQLFSTSTLIGMVWAIVNHFIITNGFNYYDSVLQNSLMVNILSIGFHTAIFLGLLTKFLDWNVLWNMGIVISVLEKETGLDALEISAYYGRHSKRTGFELMLVFFAYCVILKLPFVLATTFGFVSFGVVELAIVTGLVCLGSLVKWVAFVLYYYECKAQVLIKKVDEELGEVVKQGEVC